MNDRSLQTRLVRWAGPVLTVATASVLGAVYGVQLVVLTLAAGVLLLVISLLWNSVQALAGESELSFEEAFSMGARSAEEEQKRAVLRALKDLDYERSVGKISEEDFQEFSTRYRAEAKRLIRDLDENLAEARKQVERDLERRLRKRDPLGDDEAPPPETSEPNDARSNLRSEGAVVSATAGASPALRECTACQTLNELDARFCKACGATMAGPGERACLRCPARYAQTLAECPACGSPSEVRP